MGPHTKLYMYLKHYEIFVFVFVGVYVFNVWPKTTLLPMWPRDAKTLDTPATVLLSLYWNVYRCFWKLQKFNFCTSLLIDELLTTVTLWKSEIVWKWLFRNEIQKLQVLYTLHLLTLRYITYKSIIGHFLSIPTPHPHIPLGTKLQYILSYLFILSA